MTDLAKRRESCSGRGTVETDDDRRRGVHLARTMPAPSATSCGARSGSRSAASRRSPEVGSYLTYDILDDSIIVVRTGQNEFTISAHHNVCMHRGRRLIDTPEGAKNACGRTRKSFVCGFHGWTYGLDGACTHIREQDDWQGALTAAEHPPRAGQGRHLGRLVVDQHGPRLRAAGRLPVPRREDSRPVRPGEHALQVAQVAVLRLQLESRDGGLQRDLPRLHHASGVQQVRRVQGLGQGAGQAQQHRLRRAQRIWTSHQVQDPPRHRAIRASRRRRCRCTRWRRPTPPPPRRW